ncbi:tetratricopeptide repeat protein [Acinetobacter bereziniae]|uniref:tetratricopeptide repeat protein n=1 Tax=Acinetobacter bereziniae TaxID=106648 RepID=UPI001250B725|nr:tetratricopeptide repeat protein [Acinetobacter bereziniae]
MAFYTFDKLKNQVDYIVNSFSQIKERELNAIYENEYNDKDLLALDILQNRDFEYLIKPLEIYFPKSYQFLHKENIEFQVLFYWSENLSGKRTLTCNPFFVIKDRVYLITLPSYKCGDIRTSIYKGLNERMGGIVCSESYLSIWGKTLISEPVSWYAFEFYLPRKNKKNIIKRIVSLIPYTFTNSQVTDIEDQEKYAVKDFPNLRVLLDSREPEEQQTEYDLLLTCYDYNQNIYWVKNGDFENEIYLLSNPETAIDEYMVHVFSQAEGRFDFSPWASKLEETDIIHQIEEPEDEVEEELEGIPLLDPELAAKLGNIPAQIKLGVDYSLGRNDVEKDSKRGRDWFWQSAKFGNLLAQYNWASYWSKEPVYLETELTSTLLESLQMQGNLAATYMLGVFSEEGMDGVEQSYPLAVHFYTYAAEQGFAPAMNNLADKYENGLGVEQDLPKALALYTQAAEQDIGAAQWSLGLMYLEGKGVTQDQTKAKQWLEKAAGNGWDQAVELLKTF